MPPSATVEDAPLALTTADEVRSHGSDKPGIDEGRGDEPDSRQAQDTKALATRPQSLRECDLALIERTIAACGGNVKDAAKRLGVSRGLIYRRRQAAKARTTTSQA
jgi:DNA-binding NtrC family response regulator